MNRYAAGLLTGGALLLLIAGGPEALLAAQDAPAPGQATAQPDGDRQFTNEEFSSLSLAAKQDIYLHHPRLLPPGFNPKDFPEVMQPHESSIGGSR